jgi:hypothetical protein
VEVLEWHALNSLTMAYRHFAGLCVPEEAGS